MKVAQTAATQTVHPWRSSIRTGIQALVGLIVLLPLLGSAGYLDAAPWILPAVPVAAGVARILAFPQVEVWVKTWLPWMSAQPPLSHQDGTAGQ